jgi:hypothetical protein
VDWMKYRLFEWTNYYGWSIADSHFLLLLTQSTSIIWSSAFPANMGVYTVPTPFECKSSSKIHW